MAIDPKFPRKKQSSSSLSEEEHVHLEILKYLYNLALKDYLLRKKEEAKKEPTDQENTQGEQPEQQQPEVDLDTVLYNRLVNLIPYLREFQAKGKTNAINICKINVRLRRVKNAVLSKYVDKIFDEILRDQLEYWGAEEPTFDQDEQEEDNSNLVEYKDTNQMNNDIRKLWSTPPAIPPTPTETEETSKQQSPSVEEPATKKNSKKRERSSKESGSSSKRVKDHPERTSQLQIRLKDLGGIDKIIEQVLELIGMPLSHPEVYMHIGTDTPRGVLLHGPPGCGKTVLANAIANELQVPFISISAPSIVSGMSGESEKKLREVFQEAKTLAPCILFLDEIDAITPKRDNAQREMERRIVAQLLTCMDDVSMEKTGGNPVIIIGATNRPDSIDPALRRGGRFDKEICMNVPDEEARAQILKKICGTKLKLEGNFDYYKLAKLTPGFVGADLQSLVSAAGVSAIKRIFKLIQTKTISQPSEEGNKEDVDMTDLATEPLPTTTTTTTTTKDLSIDESSPASIIESFLNSHPLPLSDQELEPLYITFDDFMTALPTIQPSSKREGFATVPDVTWNDVGALTKIREELEYAIVEPIQNPKLYKSVGINSPAGVLLWGPPGCGKTLLAKAVANESQANFISVRGPELLNKYVGESERAVRQVFTRARASIPCVIFFDELDALVPKRGGGSNGGGGGDSSSEATSRVVNTLLTELDGVGDRKGIYVVAATNRPDMIDSAMLRPGRLDKQLYVDLPEADERFSILKTVTKNTPLDPNSVDLKAIAHDERCQYFSGADLSALTREAAIIALKRAIENKRAKGNTTKSTTIKQQDEEEEEEDEDDDEKVLVTGEDFKEAFTKVRPSVSQEEIFKYKAMYFNKNS